MVFGVEGLFGVSLCGDGVIVELGKMSLGFVLRGILERSVFGVESIDSVDFDLWVSFFRSGFLKWEVYGCE